MWQQATIAAMHRPLRSLALLPCLLALCLAACHAPAPATPPPFELVVLGIAQDGGVPQLGCDQPCCAEARASGRALGPACLGVIDHRHGKLLLVEATPAVERQVALLHQLAGTKPRGRQAVDGILLTHAHIGHYLGLAHFGREAAASRQLPVFAAPRLAQFLRREAPWRQLIALEQIAVVECALDAALEPLPGLTAVPLRVPHRDEFSETVAWRLTGPTRTVLFVPDVDRWDSEPGLLDRLLAGVDVAYVDGTFFDGSELPDRDLREIRHPFVTDTMARLQELAKARPGAVRFLHLNHTNPALRNPAVRARIAALGFAVAEEGERIGL